MHANHRFRVSRGAVKVGSLTALIAFALILAGFLRFDQRAANAVGAAFGRPPRAQYLAQHHPALETQYVVGTYTNSIPDHDHSLCGCINTRPPLPRVPDGRFIPALAGLQPTLLPPAGNPVASSSLRSPRANTDPVVIVQNTSLRSGLGGNTASSVDEPSVAKNGDVVFYSGNWYAAVSTDAGKTFKLVDPYTFFPSASAGFCCDQVVHYIPQIDTFVWLLQYIKDGSGNNTDRLAYATTDQVKSGQWKFVDLTSQKLNLSGQWMDFPDMAVGSNSLYLTTNVFDNSDKFTEALVLRFPTSGFTANNVTFDTFSSSAGFSFRVAQNCDTRAFFASHNSTSQLGVFTWDEGSQTVNAQGVDHATYAQTDYSTKTPDNFDWTAFSDPRVLGAAKAGNELWFSWDAARGGANSRLQPYTEIVRIDATTLTLIDQPSLFNPAYAICYAALSSNSRNEVGISFSFGGPTQQVAHAIGILTGTKQFVTTATGTDGPSGNRWGDYLTVRPDRPNGKLFVATGFTMQGGNKDGNADPHFIEFGRSGETIAEELALTFPKGGEAVFLNDKLSITWTSQGFIGNDSVKLEISRDSGVTWSIIAAKTPDTGSFDWTVTGPLTDHARIRITSIEVPLVSAATPKDFRIVTGSLKVLSPNGGEVLRIGKKITITWNAQGFAQTGSKFVKLELSRDGGGSWETLFNTTPNDGAQDWVVTGPATENASVRVTATSFPALSDTSDNLFSIREIPTLTVVSPNGGETLVAGDTVPIVFTSTGLVGDVSVEVSTDGGVTWNLVSSVPLTAGQVAWQVPDVPTHSARVRITALGDDPISDLSNGLFSIVQPSLTVTAPTAAKIGVIGQPLPITWTSVGLNAGGSVRIDVSRDGGSSFQTVISAAPNSGSGQWTVTGPATSQAVLRVASLERSGVAGESEQFAIAAPTLRLRAPSAGTRWLIGHQAQVRWGGTVIGYGTVMIELSRNGGKSWKTLAAAADNTGGLSVGVTGPPARKARVRITWNPDPTLRDQSPGFRIGKQTQRKR